jgi:hypothetical protein
MTSRYYKLHPLHPLFKQRGESIITEENNNTFIQTEESVLESVQLWGPSIMYVADLFITYELYNKALENNCWTIGLIKTHLLTKEEYYQLCLQAVKKNGYTLKCIRKNIQSQELVDTAINSSCNALQYSLDKFKTYNNCLLSVKGNGQNIEYVPHDLIDKEMCEAAAKSRYTCLNFIPKEFLTQELCREAVKANGKNIKNVPEEFMSSELAYLSITSPEPSDTSTRLAGSNIQYISAKYLTKEIILESVRRWSPTYGTIPKECLTDEIEDEVLNIDPSCIKHMKQTPEKCMKAIKVRPYVIGEYINLENITKEMVQYIEALPYSEKTSIKKMFKKEDLKYLKSLLKD